MSDFLETLADAVMDTLEDFFSSFTVPTGKNLVWSLVILVGFFIMSIVTWLFDIPCFVSIKESLTAVIIMGLICLIDQGNRIAIKSITDKLKNKVKKYKEEIVDD